MTEDAREPDQEQRHAVDGGIRFNCPFGGTCKLGGFYTLRRDAIVLTGGTFVDADGFEREYYGNRDVEQYGIELDCRSPEIFGCATLFWSALLMDSRIEDSSGDETDYAEVPDEILTAGVYLDVGRFDVNAFGKYVGSYENDRFTASGEPEPLGDYTDINLTAGVRLGRERNTRVYGKVENILNDDYSTVVGFYDPGRRVSVGVQHVF